MAVKTKSPSRDARERARAYEARKALHEAQLRRRTRDNVILAVVAGVVILGAVGAQALYYTSGPGAPEPAVSEAPAVEPTPPAVTPAP